MPFNGYGSRRVSGLPGAPWRGKNEFMKTDSIPKGYHSLTPYLTVEGADKLVQFMKTAFDAQEVECTTRFDGTIANVVLKIGDSMVMAAEAIGRWTPMPAGLYFYVPDVDEIYRRALAAGGESLMEPADQFYGDRNAGVRDVAGNFWWIATRIEDVSPEEMERRAAEAMKSKKA